MLEDLSKQTMLDAWGAVALEVALFDDTDTELDTAGYERQTIGWSYDGGDVILNADLVMGEDYIAQFDINPDPTVTVSYVKYFTDGGDLLATHTLGNDEETYNNPGTFDILAASLEII